MPFDSSPEVVPPAKTLSPEHARLLAIAVMLETDPEVRASWNFDHPGTETDCGFIGCAIGWAVHRGMFAHGCGDRSEQLGLSWNTYATLFGWSPSRAYRLYGRNHHDITPDMVARAIRSYLAERYPASALRQDAMVRT